MAYKGKTKKKNSLKNRLFQIIMISTIVSILATFVLSSMTISFVEKKQIQKSMRFSLHQISTSLDQGYLNLVNIMQNLEPQGSSGRAVTDYLMQSENYEKRLQRYYVQEQLANILFTNLNVRRFFYEDASSKEVLFTGGSAYGKVSEQKKELKQVGDNLFFAIENDKNKYQSQYLISMEKQKQKFGESELDIYLEVQLDDLAMEDYRLLQLNENMEVLYSEADEFPQGEKLNFIWSGEAAENSFREKEYYLLMEKSRMGFYYILAVPLSVYNHESREWQKHSILIFAVTLAVFYSIVLVVYRMIGKPIEKLKYEIEETGKGKFEVVEEDIGMEEFNQILATISRMRQNIRELQEQERRGYELRKKAELEKLMYQINPHFVLNTLYSVQWMAQRDGNLKIREFVHDLTVILSYNLGKENGSSTLRTEVEIARKYIEIQKQRYDFEVMLQIEEGSYLDVPTIHMLLQPLLENALQHGLGDRWRLELWIFEDVVREYAGIIVRDYGDGLSQEDYRRISQPLGMETDNAKKAGIGFRYVRYMLESFYGEKAVLNVNSMKGRGTKISILIPLGEKGVQLKMK